MTEKRMVFWNVRKLSIEFGISRHSVGRILSSIKAKKWSSSKGGSSVWYWEED